MSRPEMTTVTHEEMAEMWEKLKLVSAASIRVVAALANEEEPDPADVELVENNDLISPVHMDYTSDWVPRFSGDGDE